MRKVFYAGVAIAAAIVTGPACFPEATLTGGPSGTGASSQSSATSSTGGAAGHGGATSGGGTMSTATMTSTSTGCMDCYDGPAATKGVGACKDGCTMGATCAGEVVPTAEVCASGKDDNCDGTTGCTGTPLWSHSYGDVSDMQRGNKIRADRSGNLIVASNFVGNLGLGGAAVSATTASVIKLDPAGNVLWAKQFGGAQNTFALGLGVDPAGEVLVTGTISGTTDFGGGNMVPCAGMHDVFVLKLAGATGDTTWVHAYGDANDQLPGAIAADSAGNVLVTGYFAGSISFGGQLMASAGADDIFVAKLAPDGSHVWSQRYGDAADQLGLGIAVDSADNVILTGDFEGTFGFGGPSLTPFGSADIFVAKLDSKGAYQWAHVYGDAKYQEGDGLATGPGDAIFVTGETDGSVSFGGGALAGGGGADIFVAKLSSAGDYVYGHVYGDAADQTGNDIAVDAAGNALITGDLEGTAQFDALLLTSAGVADVFVAKLDPAGSTVWAQRYGDAQDQRAKGIAVDLAGNVLLTGYFSGTIGFGGPVLTSAGAQDIFVAKLMP